MKRILVFMITSLFVAPVFAEDTQLLITNVNIFDGKNENLKLIMKDGVIYKNTL